MSKVSKLFRFLYRFLFGSNSEKRMVRHASLRKLAEFMGGYYVLDDHLNWLKDKDFIDLYKELDPNDSSMERKFLSLQVVKSLKYVDGDTAECGCYKGLTSYFICKYRDRKWGHHIFDSFQGLSEPGEEDVTSQSSTRNWIKGDMQVNEESVRKMLNEFDNVHLHPGWIPGRFKDTENHHFAFVHIDVDLYEPTLKSIEFFYPRMNQNGIMIFDDYGFATCPGATKACDEFFRDKKEEIIHIPTGQGMMIKS